MGKVAKRKDAGGQTRAALDTTYRPPNHSYRIAAAQHIRDHAALCFESAVDDCQKMVSLRGINEKQMGLQILHAMKSVHINSTVASHIECRYTVKIPAAAWRAMQGKTANCQAVD